MAQVEAIYLGELAAMLAEVGTFDAVASGAYHPAAARYAVQPIGDSQWDAVYLPTLADARAEAAEMADAYGVGVVQV